MKLRFARVTFPILCLMAFAAMVSAAAQESAPGDGPIQIAEGITIESITHTPTISAAGFPYSVGLQRITIQPGVELDLVALLGHGYPGPVHYYVERGEMTVDVWSNLTVISKSSQGSIQPFDGAKIPDGVAIYAEDGDIGPVRNSGVEPLEIFAIVIVPELTTPPYEEEIVVVSAASPSP